MKHDQEMNGQRKRTKGKENSWTAKIADKLRPTLPRILPYRELAHLYRGAREEGWIRSDLPMSKFLTALVENGAIHDVELLSVKIPPNEMSRHSRHLYVCGAPSPFTVAISLRPRSYLSHASAMAIQGLTLRSDFPIYGNQEQTRKVTLPGKLEQVAIDRAFQNRARFSTYAFEYQQSTIVLLSGKNTDNYGVEEIIHESGNHYPVTSIPRTLVDIAVRPIYAGGVAAVLEAFRQAKTRANPDVLIAEIAEVLNAVSHAYPYHQAIGFYLERAGFANGLTEIFYRRGTTYDFYLDYQIRNPAYDHRWRMYFPSDLQ